MIEILLQYNPCFDTSEVPLADTASLHNDGVRDQDGALAISLFEDLEEVRVARFYVIFGS